MPIYCLKCKSNNIQEVVEQNHVLYNCQECFEKSGRALIVDNKIKIIKTARGIKHISVAAIIIKDGKMLFGDRRTYPFGLEIPVGHLEYDETLEEAIRREVYEEVGIKVKSETLAAQIEQPISYCRYGSDVEEWAIFRIECAEAPDFVGNNELQAVEWIDVSAIPVERLTAQTAFALKSLGYIQDQSR